MGKLIFKMYVVVFIYLVAERRRYQTQWSTAIYGTGPRVA
jgi:hypothetical protein